MARLTSDKTTRVASGSSISAADLTLFFDSTGGENDISTSCDPRDLGWHPLMQQMVCGPAPSLFTFRQAFIPAAYSASGVNEPANIVNVKRITDIFRPDPAGTIRRQRIGFSKYDSSASNSKPPTTSEIEIYRQRLHFAYPVAGYPELDIYDRATNVSNELFLGRYYLSSNAGRSMDGAILAFADARFLNYNKPMWGVWVADSNGTRRFSRDNRCHFNPNGFGNKATAQNTGNAQLDYLFTNDWKYKISNSSDNAWSLWDMLMYIFEQGYVDGIETPTATDFEAFYIDAHYQYLDIDVTALTVTEAIDKIISAAGEYTWTLVPTDSAGAECWKIAIIEYSRWQGNEDVNDDMRNEGMPARDIYLPTPGVALALSNANVIDVALDENISMRTGHIIALGEPIEIETTFSTDGNSDYSCIACGPDGGSTINGSGVVTLEWLGNTTAFNNAYNACTGNASEKLAAGMEADENAYRVCALKIGLTSTANPACGYAFLPSNGSYLEGRRRLMPYRLPRPLAGGTKPGDQNERPNALLWIRKPNDTTWYSADTDKGRDLIGCSWSIDPVVGAVRFAKPVFKLNGTAFDTYDIMLTAVLQLEERLSGDIWRDDWKWKTSLVGSTDKKLKFSMRWNAMLDVGWNYTEIVQDDRNELTAFSIAQFGKADRNRASAAFTVPWVERIYSVGDWLQYIHIGSSDAGSMVPVQRRELGAAIVGVEIDYQTQETRVRCENWRQE